MKYSILFVCINMIFTSCDSFVDRTFGIFNESSHQVEVTAYSNRNLQHEGTSKNQGSVLSFSASFDPEAETISLFVGDSVNFIFDDSLVLVHYSTTRPTIIDSPSFDKTSAFKTFGLRFPMNTGLLKLLMKCMKKLCHWRIEKKSIET